MKKIKSRNVNLVVLFSISIFVSSIILQTSIIKNESNRLFLIDDQKDLKSSYISRGPISIDNFSSNNWVDAKNTGICTGAGSEGNPYVIQNYEIDCGGSGSGITIENSVSSIYYKIQNCLIYDSGSGGGDAAIKLLNVHNGRIISNNLTSNNGYGILISYTSEWHLSFPSGYWTYHPSDHVEIWNNTITYNNGGGIYIKGRDDSDDCDNINMTENIVSINYGNGIIIEEGSTNFVVSNDCLNNDDNGIYLYESEDNDIIDNDCHSNDNGIKLWLSNDNTILDNNANNNREAGILLDDSGSYSLNNVLSTNTVIGNKYGIYLVSSNYNYIGTSNTATSNTKYGIYISDGSHDNTISGNTASSNAIWDICYDDDCEEDNTFTNNNIKAINVDNPPSGGGFPIEYLFTILFLIFFVAVIGSVGYLSRKKSIRLREQGVVQSFTEEQPRVVFVRPGLAYQDQSSQYGQHSSSSNHYGRDSDHKPITPKEIEPYEFYCAKCDQKSLGYQVFCSTCGERMRQPKLAAMHDPNEKVQCVICHSEMCPSCNHEITGDDACYEECPYCERSYHKHCWEKTMQGFGKCGFCLETPPPELIPNYYK